MAFGSGMYTAMNNISSPVKKVYWCHKEVRIEYEIRYTPNYGIVYIWVYYSWFKTPREIILPLEYWRGEEIFCKAIIGRLF